MIDNSIACRRVNAKITLEWHNIFKFQITTSLAAACSRRLAGGFGVLPELYRNRRNSPGRSGVACDRPARQT